MTGILAERLAKATNAAFDRLHPRDDAGKFLPKGSFPSPRRGLTIESLFQELAGEAPAHSSERTHHREFDKVPLNSTTRRQLGIEKKYFSVTDPERELSKEEVAGLLDYQSPDDYATIQAHFRGAESADPKLSKEGDAFANAIRTKGKSQKGRRLWRVMDFNTAQPDWQEKIIRAQPFAVKSPQLFSLGEDRHNSEMIGERTHRNPATFKVHVEAETPAIDTAAWFNGDQVPEVIYPPGTTLEYRGTPQNADGTYDLYLT